MIKEKKNKLLDKLNLEKLPFKVDETILRELGSDIAQDLRLVLGTINTSNSLKWCMSTVKKAKVFTLIYQANETGSSIYKEEISKKLPEYSYKTIATIVDEGVERGFYIPKEPHLSKVNDKKIKNIRPSEDVVVAFLNWNIERIVKIENLISKYKNLNQ
ncbi:hypothetical protein OAS47_00380 [Pelagibacteraceae bacterium]|nr:hypothetical protein [Pelagibacteraceae bacterium]